MYFIDRFRIAYHACAHVGLVVLCCAAALLWCSGGKRELKTSEEIRKQRKEKEKRKERHQKKPTKDRDSRRSVGLHGAPTRSRSLVRVGGGPPKKRQKR